MSDDALREALERAYENDLIELPEDPSHRWCDEDAGGNHRFDRTAWLNDLVAALATTPPASAERGAVVEAAKRWADVPAGSADDVSLGADWALEEAVERFRAAEARE